MKLFYCFLLSLICLSAHSQIGGIIPNPGKPSQVSHGISQIDWVQVRNQLMIPKDTINVVDSVNNIALIDSTLWGRVLVNGVKQWIRLIGNNGALGELISGGPISSNDIIGFDPGADISAAEWIRRVFYQSQPPTAAISPGVEQELMAAGSPLTVTVTWTAGRLAKTAPITAVQVGGFPQTYSGIPAPGSASGTQAVSIQRNQTTSIQNLVTASDGKTALAIAVYSFYAQGYHGWVSSVAGIGTQGVYDDSQIRSLAFGKLTSRAYGGPSNSFDPGPTINKYFVYAYPASFGELQNFVINGIGSKDAMLFVQRNFTNTSGYTQLYNFYYSSQIQSPSGAYPTYAY